MKKRRYLIIAVLLLAAILSGCSKPEDDVNKDAFNVYYVNALGTKVVPVPTELKATSDDGKIKEVLKILSSDPSDSSYKRTIPKGVKVNDYKLDKGKLLKLYFNSKYGELEGISELLSRAAIVKTLCQISKKIEYVQFYVDEQTLMIGDGIVGMMKGTNFIDNSGESFNYENEKKLCLYFANYTGNKLKKTYVKVKYDGTTPLERLVVNQLLAGPDAIENRSVDIYATMTKGTVLNTISTSNGVCYVDFNKQFLKKLMRNTDDVTVYSVVNSLRELSTINKVQITINDEKVKTYNSITDFDKLLDRNYKIIEK